MARLALLVLQVAALLVFVILRQRFFADLDRLGKRVPANLDDLDVGALRRQEHRVVVGIESRDLLLDDLDFFRHGGDVEGGERHEPLLGDQV